MERFLKNEDEKSIALGVTSIENLKNQKYHFFFFKYLFRFFFFLIKNIQKLKLQILQTFQYNKRI